jgi:hypothetical protein
MALAAQAAGTMVTVVGTGVCSVYAQYEDISYMYTTT